MLYDTYVLRDYLRRIFRNPSLKIEGTAKASGQRVVYFCIFESTGEDPDSELLAKAVSWGPVVLKISEGHNPQAVAYLEKEIEVLNGFDSSFYPKLLFSSVYSHDPDTEEALPHRFFVTIEERLDAVPLTSCMKDYRDEKSAILLTKKLTEALNLMWTHPSKLVHRDLKPDNILIKKDGGVAIIDLGILREEGTIGITHTCVPWGPCSLPYASPEQVLNDKRNISFKSDHFVIGILMYEMLMGENPFTLQDLNSSQAMDRICNFTPPRIPSQTASKELADLIEKLLSKQPYKRFRRVEDLEEALENLK